MLLTRTPFLRILVEVRVGLFHVTLVRRQYVHNNSSYVDLKNGISEYKWISGDYIHLPEDGFFYVGLKYSAQEVAAKPTGRVQFVGNLEEEVGLKGRMCVGPIKIDCNEAAMRLAMGQAIADELRASNMDVSNSTHFSVLQDAYHSFISLIAHLPKRKGVRKGYAKNSSPHATERFNTSNAEAEAQDTFSTADHMKLERSAKRTRMLHALLLRSSMVEVEVGTLELNLSAYTSHIEKALRTQAMEVPKSPETREEVNVTLPTTTYRLHNRPSVNECIVDVAGARVVYRSTKQGRAAVIRHLAQLFKL
ncbi:Vacuolar protein sorting-associated protein 13A N-terminal domain [Phytophthora cinnamomi]|uniref:Vacuolar protein sorting-associated protein 13A N-terminal domain n=1 Tax=Phytophthora cinnamomi TaxID=4785 RepID=UPI003559AF68|nr:Vacuolar protein sorting-associated protein 13A N-terminal domain [Phytophthora cinnamomi]